jgi:hypothetical protein
MAQRWEYKFIETHRNEYNDLKRVVAEVGAAGADGWEAVGPVTLSCTGITMPSILFKRPVP